MTKTHNKNHAKNLSLPLIYDHENEEKTHKNHLFSIFKLMAPPIFSTYKKFISKRKSFPNLSNQLSFMLRNSLIL